MKISTFAENGAFSTDFRGIKRKPSRLGARKLRAKAALLCRIWGWGGGWDTKAVFSFWLWPSAPSGNNTSPLALQTQLPILPPLPPLGEEGCASFSPSGEKGLCTRSAPVKAAWRSEAFLFVLFLVSESLAAAFWKPSFSRHFRKFPRLFRYFADVARLFADVAKVFADFAQAFADFAQIAADRLRNFAKLLGKRWRKFRKVSPLILHRSRANLTAS